MEADFYAILTGHTALTNLVPATKITASNYKQGATGTLIRYSKVSGITGIHMTGSDGLSDSLMQIDIRGLASSGIGPVMAVRDVLVAVLHPYRGIQGSTDFQVINLTNDRGVQFEKPDTVEYFTCSLDFNVWSRAAA